MKAHITSCSVFSSFIEILVKDWNFFGIRKLIDN